MKTYTAPRTPLRRLVTGCAMLLLSLSVFQQAQADTGTFHMMAVIDSASGELLTDGKYRQAIDKISAKKRQRNSFAAHNNLCVAYTKTRSFDEASEACDAAVQKRRRVGTTTAPYAPALRGASARDHAVALSNRGVLRAVTGDIKGAREDFEASLALSDDFEEPQQNLVRLETYQPTATTAQNAH